MKIKLKIKSAYFIIKNYLKMSNSKAFILDNEIFAIVPVFFHLLITQKLMYGPRALWPMKFLVLKTHFIMVWTVEHTGMYNIFLFT